MTRPEPWLVSYGLLGLTQSGLVPVLMPLAAPHGTAAGLTFAAFSLSGIFAPFLGSWADRTGRHRDLLVWGTLGAGLLLVLFAAAALPLRVLLAAGAGLGAMAATSAGNVVAIQGMPEAEWESRVALLQRFTSAGQVIGLIAAGLLAQRHPSEGFVFAGVTLLAASALAFASAPSRSTHSPAAAPPPTPILVGNAGIPEPHRHRHHLSWSGLSASLTVIDRPMRRFLLIWLIGYSAMNGFAALFPVAMIRQYGMDPILPSGSYALGVGFSLAIYSLVGAATHRLGGARMLMRGFAARLALLAVLAGLGLSHAVGIGWLVLFGFALVQFVWPLIAVSANSLSVRLAPTARGASVGLFNAATALASAIGSALAGMVYDAGGFALLAGAAGVTVAASLLVGEFWLWQPLNRTRDQRSKT
ncbi:MAG TPA: MFS transporter [Stellaceae bacterium]|jgi:MFS family permease|nr:MFS transporter [Stellaceae bacterium]